jgi:hypothetical protein
MDRVNTVSGCLEGPNRNMIESVAPARRPRCLGPALRLRKRPKINDNAALAEPYQHSHGRSAIMLNTTLTTAAIFAALLGSAGALACEPLQPQALEYLVQRGDTKLGTGEIRLRPAQAQGCFVLEQTATPYFFLRWLSGPATQSSEFCQLPDGTLRSYSYKQFRTGVGAEKENYALTFDWSAGVVRGAEQPNVPLQAELSDALLLQMRVRRWLCEQPAETQPESLEPLSLSFVDDDGLDSYTFAVTAQEVVKVPAGEIPTLRVERIDAPDRFARFWLDPQRAYAVIRAEQQKADDPPIRLSLRKDLTPREEQ